MANTSIDLTALKASLGDYYRSNGRILSLQSFLDLEKEGINVYTGIQDEEPLLHPIMKDILQPGGAEHDWNPTTGAFSFGDRTMKVRDWSVDLSIRPKAFQKTFLNRLTPPGSNPYNMDGSFEALLVENILKGIQSGLGKAVWQGVYDAAAVAAGSADPFRIIDGFKKIIVDAITATAITPVATGVITSTNAVASIEAVFKNASSVVVEEGGVIHLAPEVLWMYNEDYRTRYGGVAYNKDFQKRTLELSGGMVDLVPVKGLIGSQRVIFDPKGVMAIGTDLEEDEIQLTFEQSKRDIDVIADGKIGAQVAAFAIDGIEYISVNDQV